MDHHGIRNLSAQDNGAQVPQPRLPGIKSLLNETLDSNHLVPAQHLTNSPLGYPSRSMPIWTGILAVDQVPLSPALASPGAADAMSEASGSVSSASRQCSMSPTTDASNPRAKRRTKRGSESQSVADGRVAKRPAPVQKKANEQAHRKDQATKLAQNEDFLDVAVGFKAPKSQSASNSRKSGLSKDKQQIVVATTSLCVKLTQERLLLEYENGGDAGVEQFKREVREYLAASLGVPEEDLSMGCYMVDEDGGNGNFCCVSFRRGRSCSHDDLQRIDIRKQRRAANFDRNFARARQSLNTRSLPSRAKPTTVSRL